MARAKALCPPAMVTASVSAGVSMPASYNLSCEMQQPQLFDLYNVGCNCHAMELKDRVRQARKHAKLTQKQLAALAGVSQQAIQKLERGRSHTSSALGAIAVACNVSTAWLVHETGEMLVSQSLRSEHEKLVSRRIEIGLSVPDVHARMLSFAWPDGVEPPDLATVEDWFSGRRRLVDMTYRGMLYRALDIGSDSDVPMNEGVAKTEVGARLLRLAETGDPEEAIHMLAMWEAMRKGRTSPPE